MSTKYWTPAPQPGDIVDCCFPEEVGKPGPKERPALVIQVEEAPGAANRYNVEVAYATSQKTSKVYAGEFVVKADSMSGLTADTKFDLLNTHLLPFDDMWFKVAPGEKHPRRGRLDIANLDIKKRLHSALVATAAEQKRLNQKPAK